MRRDAFSTYHPLINAVYFTAVLACGMVFMHPVFQGAALLGAIVYSAMLHGRKAARFHLLYMLPILLILAVANPLFNHAGVTILFYLRDGNPVTLESILYGASASCMLVTVTIWFSCFNKVMTSDKLIHLLGRALPAWSLLFSMVLRFVPRFRSQLRAVSLAQRSIGRDATQGNVIQRARHGLRILSIMATWAMENAIETADAMKARGYGLPGRTSFAIFRFDRRDMAALAALAALLAVVLLGAGWGENTIRFFPSIHVKERSLRSAAVYAAYACLCLLPAMIQLVEDIKWKSIASKT
ncbi:energy-coupling factor transporter transmembrane protein EcfT [Paenibacillus lycopersici]|uniref:Energy-coupling factor transporter transmembrane protein EcfT n=1 Tax=Paenibacillus lycopersici TaxID=2704462 RepID=A0A6C0FWZ4_9BACL|nr:energy-coupling factor transporter transmembrane component T [Paenibacillus lycopersici]QHT59814.1 energy-coupling factor transporter transmembrane protein EcfT [Paenibacillus lycopersici]